MHKQLLTHGLYLLRALFAAIAFAATASSVTTTAQVNARESTPTPIVDDIDLLAINDEIKALLDKRIRPIKTKVSKTKALHELLFDENEQHIRYDFKATHTAQQTFDRKSGNCISHAALYVAAARYLGLNADFQSVGVPPTWEKQNNYYLVPGHLNVVVRLPGFRKATVEFVAMTFYSPKKVKLEKISDLQVLSEFYNNLGADALERNEFLLGQAYFEKAIQVWEHSVAAWSNLGVSQRLRGNVLAAEQAYKKGLSIDSRNMTLLNNLYALYRYTGEAQKAEMYYSQVERYSKKNPYNLLKIAMIDLENGDYLSARRALDRAIKIKKDEPDFHHALAKVFYKAGDFDKVIAELKKAESLANSDYEKNRFRHKLDMLANLYKPH